MSVVHANLHNIAPVGVDFYQFVENANPYTNLHRPLSGGNSIKRQGGVTHDQAGRILVIAARQISKYRKHMEANDLVQ